MTKSNRAGKVRVHPAAQSARTIPNAQITAWSNPQQLPTRKGVYEIRPEYGTPHRMFAAFDIQWYGESQTAEGAQANAEAGEVRANQQVTWRGIVK